MSEEVFFQYAEERFMEGDFNKAIAFLDKTLELNPANEIALYRKGQCLMVLSSYNDAIAYFEKALTIDKDWSYPHAGIGDCLRMTNQSRDAFQQYTTALSIDPDTLPAILGIGYLLNEANQYNDAISYFKRYIELDQSNPNAYLHLGETYRLTGQMETARNYYQNALEIDSNCKLTLHRMGETFKQEENYEEAMKWFHLEIAANPENEQAYYSMGECLRQLNEYEESYNYYDLAIQKKPEWAEPYCGLADALRMHNHKLEAIPWFVKAIEYGDNSSAPYYGIAECYRFLEDYPRAIECFMHALGKNGDDADILYKIGQCYLLRRQFDEALLYFNQSLQLNPENGELYCCLAEYQMIQRNFQQAINYLIQADNYISPSRMVFLTIGKYFMYLKDTNDIEFAIDRILHHYQDRLPDCSGENIQYQQYFYAKFFLLQAASVYNKDYIPYETLTRIPPQYFSPLEPSPINYFYHLCFAWKHKPESLHKSTKKSIFNMALASEIPILVIDMATEDTEQLAGMKLSSDLLEPLLHTRTIRKQMLVWQQKPLTIEKVNLYAICSLYINNPVAAYDIYTSFLKEQGNDHLDATGHYYYALVAHEIIIDHKAFLAEYSIPFIGKELQSPHITAQSKYYCALILLLTPQYEEGIIILKELAATGHKASRYKLAEFTLYEMGEEEASALIAKLSADWHATEDYYKFPQPIQVSSNENEAIQQIRPLVEVMENTMVLHCIFQFQTHHSQAGTTTNNFFNNRFFFPGLLYFPHLASEKEKEYFQKEIPYTYAHVFGSEQEQVMLQPDLRYYKDIYSLRQDISQHIGEKIHAYAYTQYSYYKNEFEDVAPHIDFRYYLILISNCLNENLLSNEEAAELQEYTKYCANQIRLVKPGDPVLEYAYEEVISFLKSAIQLHSGFDYLERAFKMLSNTVLKNQSDLISFNKYQSLLPVTQEL